VEQRIVIKFLGENVLSAEIHHRLQQQYGEECLLWRPRNRWQDEVKEEGRLVGEKGWKDRVYNRDEWKKLLRTAMNHHILHITMQ